MRTINYNGYTVGENGTVYGKFGKEIGTANSNGYTYVSINGKQMLRHRVVWEAFNGVISDGLEVDHIIPIKNGGTDSIDNLRLTSHKDNCNNNYSKKNYSVANTDKKITDKHKNNISKAKIKYWATNRKTNVDWNNPEDVKMYNHLYYLKKKYSKN